jgi:hypothetical protein
MAMTTDLTYARTTLPFRDYAEAHSKLVQNAHRTRQRVTRSVLPLEPRVNMGRWIADCQCGAGVAVDHTWPTAICFDCCTMHPIAWEATPGSLRAVVAEVLMDRPDRRTRSWEPHESIADLVQESVQLGVYDKQLRRGRWADPEGPVVRGLPPEVAAVVLSPHASRPIPPDDVKPDEVAPDRELGLDEREG